MYKQYTYSFQNNYSFVVYMVFSKNCQRNSRYYYQIIYKLLECYKQKGVECKFSMNGAFNLGDLSQRNFYKEFHEANQYLIKMSYLQIFKVKRKTHSQFYFISFYSLYSLYSKTILIGANSSINIFLPGFFLVLQKKNLKLLKRRFLHTIVKNLLKISS